MKDTVIFNKIKFELLRAYSNCSTTKGAFTSGLDDGLSM